jgi:trimethylamine--corrinoid protein Co-methyltransferase
MIKNTLPPYEYLREEDLLKIEATSFRILEEIGLEFLYPEALEIWDKAGVKVDHEAQRVWLPRELVQEKLKLAPETFELHARNPANNVIIGGDNMVCAPAYGSPFVYDLDHGRRSALLEDFVNIVKLAQMTPEMSNAGGTVVEPEDTDLDTRHLDMVYSLIKYSDKTFMGSVTTAANARDTVELAALVGGGREAIARKPMVISLINVNSPLRYDERMVGALIEYARAGQAVIVTPFIIAGAMSPAALGGTLAQQNAEALAGITLAQIINPGTPVVYGSFLTNMDMQSGSPVFGTPESAIALFASAQMARRYRLPFRSGGGLTASKLPDAQAAYESTMGFWPTFLARVNYVLHAAGWLESGLVMGYEKFVIDLEVVRMMALFLNKGVALDDEGLAWDALEEVGPGGHFLGAAHTMRHFRDAFYRSKLSDANNFERWQKQGGKDTAARANALWKKMLADYQAPPLDPGADEALVTFMDKRKKEIAAETL